MISINEQQLVIEWPFLSFVSLTHTYIPHGLFVELLLWSHVPLCRILGLHAGRSLLFLELQLLLDPGPKWIHGALDPLVPSLELGSLHSHNMDLRSHLGNCDSHSRNIHNSHRIHSSREDRRSLLCLPVLFLSWEVAYVVGHNSNNHHTWRRPRNALLKTQVMEFEHHTIQITTKQ